MEAVELYNQDGKSAGIFYCKKCRRVAATKEKADNCCKPTLCQHCGKESGRPFWNICNNCEKIQIKEKEKARFDAAEKLTEWNGWIYAPTCGYNEGFFSSIDELIDVTGEYIEDLPEYVWTCKAIQFVNLDLSDFTGMIYDEAYEGFELDSLNNLKELEKAIKEFNDANKDKVSYEPDYKRCVLINKSQYS